MNSLHFGLAATAALMTTASASASIIYGLNLRGDNQFFQSTTDNFVGDFANVGPASYDSFALDMDLTATTMYAALWDDGMTNEYGTIDVNTGQFTSLGNLVGPNIGDNISGMSVDPISGSWYLTVVDPAQNSVLYSGDITTGVFSAVGDLGTGFLDIDLAIDSQGNAYGHDIATDLLLSIDLDTGAATPIGSTGFNANFAQGMDFDYSTDTLYATLYTGGGTGQFGFFDLDTALVPLADTAGLDAEMEMAVAVAIPAPGVLVPFGLAIIGFRRRRRA